MRKNIRFITKLMVRKNGANGPVKYNESCCLFVKEVATLAREARGNLFEILSSICRDAKSDGSSDPENGLCETYTG